MAILANQAVQDRPEAAVASVFSWTIVRCAGLFQLDMVQQSHLRAKFTLSPGEC